MTTPRTRGTAPPADRRERGRPSLGHGPSPQIRVRVPEDLRRRAEQRAEQTGTSVSDLTREALEEVLRPVRREERVQQELHRDVLVHLVRDRDSTVSSALRNLDHAHPRVRGDQAHGWLDEWRRLLVAPDPSPLIDVLLGTDTHSVDLRQVSPFAGVLSDAERLAAIRRARATR